MLRVHPGFSAADAKQLLGSPKASSSNTQPTGSRTSHTSASTKHGRNAHPSTLRRLRVLHLQECPTALQQLADWQTQQMSVPSTNSSSTSDDQPDSRPGLDSLQMLQLTHLGADIAQLLPQVLFGCTANAFLASQDTAGASSSSSAAVKPWPLQHLAMLHISKCKLTGHECELSVLQQLPALQSLELSHCHMGVLPAAVCACTGLTQLNFANNCVARLPDEVANLQSLKVYGSFLPRAMHTLGL